MSPSAFSPSPSPSGAVTVVVPATSANLGPGFDALGMAFQLENTVVLEPWEADCSTVMGEGAGELPQQGATIAHDAARRVFAALELPPTYFRLRLENKIPLSRGLGSSSAAIAGGLVAANEWSRRAGTGALSPERLLDLANAIEGHPDNVAPALMGGLVAAAVAADGRVAAVKVAMPKVPGFAVFIPDTELATHTARGVLPQTVSMKDAIFNLSRSSLLIAALASGELGVLSEALQDRLHQDHRAPLVPGFNELTQCARQAGALGATLSGAGPTILFWLSPDPEAASTIVGQLQSRVEETELAGRIVHLNLNLLGARVLS